MGKSFASQNASETRTFFLDCHAALAMTALAPFSFSAPYVIILLWLKRYQPQGLNTVKDQRPVNLNLLTIRQPITAVVSILHRISGILLFLSLPLLLYALALALSSAESYESVANYLFTPAGQILFLLIWGATAFHLCAGLRHILMDFGWAETLPQARLGAYLVVVLTLILIICGGIWLC